MAERSGSHARSWQPGATEHDLSPNVILSHQAKRLPSTPIEGSPRPTPGTSPLRGAILPSTVILSHQAKDPPSQRPARRPHGVPSLHMGDLRKLRMTQRDG